MPEAIDGSARCRIPSAIRWMLTCACEGRWALQFAQFVLFLDLAMVVAGRPGLYAFMLGTSALLSDIGFLLMTLATYALFYAFVARISAQVFRVVILGTPFLRLIPDLFEDFHDYDKRDGYVLSSVVMEYAILNNDTYWIDRCESAERDRCRDNIQQRDVGDAVFGLLLLSAISGQLQWIGIGGDSTPAMLAAASNMAFIIAWKVVAGLAIMLMLAAWFPKYRPVWIYHPELYRQLESDGVAS